MRDLHRLYREAMSADARFADALGLSGMDRWESDSKDWTPEVRVAYADKRQADDALHLHVSRQRDRRKDS